MLSGERVIFPECDTALGAPWGRHSISSGQGFYGGPGWGDYEGTAPDDTIAACPLLWIAGQYSEATGSWGTAIGGVAFCNPFVQ